MKEKEPGINKPSNGPSMGYIDVLPNREIWKQLAREYNGDFKVSMTAGNELEILTLTIPYKKWQLRFTISDTRPLKIQVTFRSSIDLRITISHEDFIEKIRKKLGMQEIELGYQDFDKAYLIKSNKPSEVKAIFTPPLQSGFLRHAIYSFSFETDKKTKIAETICVIQRNAAGKETMLELIDLYKLLIDNLEKQRIIE